MRPREMKRGSGVATESTNTQGKTGAGRMVSFVLIGIAAVLFVLGMMDEYVGSGFNIKPMEQFLVEPLFGHGPVAWYSLTNVTLWMALSVVSVAALMVMGTRGRAVIPSRSQSMAELAYGFVRKMVEDVAGKDALPYFPYIFTVFMFILSANFLGLIPTSFTTTSHFAVTATLALTVFLSVTILGFVKNGSGFLSLFWVSSAPLVLRPVLAIIELISYFVRPVSDGDAMRP
jgi:F-type H+-transporting ATPase subunit a